MLVHIFFRIAFKNYFLTNAVSMYSSVSHLDCASLCRFPYSSFFFNPSQHQCALANQLYWITHPEIQRAAGWKYYTFQGPCPPPYALMTTEKMCLKVESVTKLNYSEATAACAVDGAHLFHLDTAAKINAWETLHRAAHYAQLGIYLGLSDKDYAVNDFRWTDGTPCTDSNWKSGEPNNAQDGAGKDDCVVIPPWEDYKWMLVQVFFRIAFKNYFLKNAVSMYSSVSDLDCARLCQPPCSSFFYNHAEHQCALANQLYRETHPAIQRAIGWEYYAFPGPCPHPYVFMTTEKMCLKVESVTKLNYTDATAACAVDGAHLFHLDTTAKINAWETFHRAQYSNLGIYLGLSDKDYAVNDFRWTDGTACTNSNWNSGEPNNNHGKDDCVIIAPWQDYKWLDIWCSDEYYYVCELPQ